MSESNATPQAESRTGIHIIGAFAIAVAMGLMLAWIPLRHARNSGGIIRQVQRGAIGDLRLLARQETEFKARTGSFTTDLNALGIVPKTVLYKFGFARASAFGERPEVKDLDALKAAVPALNMKFSPVTQLESIDFPAAVAKHCAECTATETSFKAMAVGNLDADAVLDVWTLDEKGEVLHLVDDLADETAETK